MSVPTVVCVLRTQHNGEYTRQHVAALYDGVRKWWPVPQLRFIALADTGLHYKGVECRHIEHTREGNLSGWWAKMALYQPRHMDLGDILYFDLDTLIVGDLLEIATTTELTLLSDFGNPWAAQSGMMYLPAATRAEVWSQWARNPVKVMDDFRGDGEFLDSLYRETAQRWQTFLPEQVVSFKYHVRQRPGLPVPEGARVVCYHGKPRPWNTSLWSRHVAEEVRALAP